ncbi:hypothetical protein [Sphingobacterium paucimobilis]|nr:hypothetical protein [Sphingobacterium paucimobilis]
MKTTNHITFYSIRIFLMVFWLYVAMDKLWDWPLLVNLLLLGLSILGWYLTGPTAPMVAYTRSKRQVILFIQYPISIMVPMYRLILVRTKVFKRRFAPFPASPVLE